MFLCLLLFGAWVGWGWGGVGGGGGGGGGGGLNPANTPPSVRHCFQHTYNFSPNLGFINFLFWKIAVV